MNAFKGIAQTLCYNNKNINVISESRDYKWVFSHEHFKSNKYNTNQCVFYYSSIHSPEKSTLNQAAK